MLTIQEVTLGNGKVKVESGQLWKGTNGYGTVKVSRVAKNHIFFYPKEGGGAEHRKAREDFLRDFILIV
jgi:hypothetical protein